MRSKTEESGKKAGRHLGSVPAGKKVDNSLDIAPGQKNFALVLSRKALKGKSKLPSKKEVVMFLPESIRKVTNSLGVKYRVTVIYIEIPISKNGLRTVDLDQLMLGRQNQVRLLRKENPEAGDWYKNAIKQLAGKGHLAMTAPATIAKDDELRRIVHPNELVMYDLDSLSQEGDEIEHYQIGVYYLRRNALVKVAVELDKLIFNKEQLKEIRKKDWNAAKWYLSKARLQSSNVFVKDEFIDFVDEEAI
ncbi:hypothetical protein CVU83_02560 [Candidatus Falkowbacteria bacterium HGW-Falkowbacteria-2]|uniref:Uncharacterized protein n=1 Tax=Candidatus Falkowbacteria bacterium HGW-Falkowbacteria-2 TaxID=2013769 RepID=A0A2N2DZA8_9BACT|nr:MAG: hypothetical protein CVU83_02560 [Candidatus Falkowbacteria bacterium HGW-Falkowbacteria-2]